MISLPNEYLTPRPALRLLPSLLLCCAAAALLHCATLAQTPPVSSGSVSAGLPAGEIFPSQCLVIRAVGRGGRTPLHTDAIERQIVLGTWKPPVAGDTVALPGGAGQTWASLAANKDGVFQSPALQGGYAYVSVDLPAPRTLLLDASAHNMVYVNGEPRIGDVYQTGWTRLPVRLHAGKNDLLFQCARGELRCKLTPVTAPALLDTRDLTAPDLIAGEKEPVLAAVVVVNATDAPLANLVLQARQGAAVMQTPVPALLPLSTRKIGFRLDGRVPATSGAPISASSQSPAAPADAAQKAVAPVTLTLLERAGGRTRTLDTASLSLRVRQPNQTQKRTFVSQIDGSVQYYAINPAQDATAPQPARTAKAVFRPANGEAPALVLSLHGASVEAIGQADAYESKRWAHIVAPTNRRPYGFDWEDWGRLDALEVLNLAQTRLQTDPARTYLTGHSMGGHGTWHVGVTFPDRFAAIAPSAGWISFFSYAGGTRPTNPNPIQALLQRATLPSDTLALSSNYTQEGVYILHGSADDNVPVTQAREMAEHLRGFHHDWTYFEQPGAGHWWDVSPEPGADCVDWAPLFDFFARHRLPDEADVRQVDFVTADPGVSAWSRWAGILQQTRALELSRVNLRYDPGLRRFVGTTANVRCLALRLDALRPAGPLALDLDGQKLTDIPLPSASEEQRLYLRHDAGGWQIGKALPAGEKRPERGGPFKQAFRNRMLFVYGAKGTPEENHWALAKARYDAETFWYRGNGSIDVVSDADFLAAMGASKRGKALNPLADPDRSVILYGNRDTNAAWNALLSDSPVQTERGQVRIGSQTFRGDNIACLFVRPRVGSDTASVAVIGGSGLAGMRLNDRQNYFLSGAEYPDCLISTPDTLATGSEGILAAGFFGHDWNIETGDFVYKR